MTTHKCLFCDKPADSREHVFPAALGGRRFDWGIFCESDNNEMGKCCVKVLSRQLNFFNANLGIISDNSREPSVHIAIDPASGLKLAMTHGSVKLSEPKLLSDNTTEQGRMVEMIFGSQQQLDEWRHSLKVQGAKLQSSQSKQGKRIISGQVKVSMSFGGQEGLRAIAYVGLVYLAHRLPELVRRPELAPFLEHVKTGQGEGFVWWEDAPLMPGGYLNSYRFQHRIALSVNKKSGFVSGHVDLFSTLSFGIKFGAVPGAKAMTDLVDINPLEQRPPNDRVIRVMPDEALFCYENSNVGTEKLSAMIHSGGGQAKFAKLMRDMHDWAWEQLSPQIVQEINTVTMTPRPEWRQRLTTILIGQSQRIYNLMQSIAQSFRQQMGETEADAFIDAGLDALVTFAAEGPTTSMRARAIHALACTALAVKIEEQLSTEGCIKTVGLKELFEGRSGHHAVARMMMLAIAPDLPI